MENLEELLEKAKEKLAKINERDGLGSFFQEYLGKNGAITSVLKCMKDLPNEQKKSFGEKVNKAKTAIQTMLAEREKKLAEEKNNREQIEMCFKAMQSDTWEALFD